MLRYSLVLLVTLTTSAAALCAQESQVADPKYRIENDIPYRTEADLSEYEQQKCCLDVYVPKSDKKFPTVIWFHGGGLTGGKRFLPKELKEKGLGVIPVSYRLSPKVTTKECVDDAAAAVAWVFHHIEEYGGDRNQIYVSGHSAGGYLTSMIGLDKSWLEEYEVDANEIAGLIPFSGHTITHFTTRAEHGIDGKQPVIDEMAPLYHVRKDAPPILLITGDRELEILGRYEENAYFWRMMQVVGHPETTLYELDGFNHGGMASPAHPLLVQFVRKQFSQKPAQ